MCSEENYCRSHYVHEYTYFRSQTYRNSFDVYLLLLLLLFLFVLFCFVFVFALLLLLRNSLLAICWLSLSWTQPKRTRLIINDVTSLFLSVKC